MKKMTFKFNNKTWNFWLGCVGYSVLTLITFGLLFPLLMEFVVVYFITNTEIEER